MKNLSLTLITVLLAVLFVGCSNEDDNLKQEAKELNPKVENFLSSYFEGKAYLVESQVQTSDFTIKKILLQDSGNRIGFIVIDRSSAELVYFADINKNKNEITAKDFMKDEVAILHEPNLGEVDKFDTALLKLEKDYDTRGVRFWGWECGPEYTTDLEDCLRTCCYYVLGMSTGCSDHGCDDLPGSNAKLTKAPEHP